MTEDDDIPGPDPGYGQLPVLDGQAAEQSGSQAGLSCDVRPDNCTHESVLSWSGCRGREIGALGLEGDFLSHS